MNEYWINYLIGNNDNESESDNDNDNEIDNDDNIITDEYDDIEMYESDLLTLSNVNNN